MEMVTIAGERNRNMDGDRDSVVSECNFFNKCEMSN